MIPSILMPLAKELTSARVFEAALGLAQALEARVQATYMRPNPEVAVTLLPEVILAAGVTSEVIEREGQQAAAATQTRFEEWRNRHGGSTEAITASGGWAASWSDHVGEVEPIITRCGRLSDFIILPRPAAGEIVAQRCFDAAVFGTGRPTLLVGDTLPAAMAEHIMIAWNGSLEASRATFAAMPLLALAKRITIFTAHKYEASAVDLEDLAIALRERGMRAAEVLFPTDEQSTGAALVSAARTEEASLIVMGAYTHSRLREHFLGGVTRHLLAHAQVPLLMSH